MKRQDLEIGQLYAVRVTAKDVPVPEDPEDEALGLGEMWLFSRREGMKNMIPAYSDFDGAIHPYPQMDRAIITRGRATELLSLPDGSFVRCEVELRVPRRCTCSTCGNSHLLYQPLGEDDELDEPTEPIYDMRATGVAVPLRSVLNTWEGWLAEVAARRFEGDAWAAHWRAARGGSHPTRSDS